jgi:hypothetical protein
MMMLPHFAKMLGRCLNDEKKPQYVYVKALVESLTLNPRRL